MKHPFIVGAGAAVAGLVVWRKRGWFLNLFHKLTAHFHGLGATGMILPANADPAIVIRQLRRYGFAALQDKSPVIGLTHASYALILLDTLEEMVGRDALTAGGMDAAKIRKMITLCQDAHAEKLKGCDGYMTAVLAVERGENPLLAGAGAAPRGA